MIKPSNTMFLIFIFRFLYTTIIYCKADLLIICKNKSFRNIFLKNAHQPGVNHKLIPGQPAGKRSRGNACLGGKRQEARGKPGRICPIESIKIQGITDSPCFPLTSGWCIKRQIGSALAPMGAS
jgi:hypothetical protein